MTKTNKGQSYQELKQALDAVLAKLQHPDTDIDAAITLHAEGQKVLNQLDAYLQTIAASTEIKIKKID
jgi:exonuclease VII small subunit